jgi:hypothetical protein
MSDEFDRRTLMVGAALAAGIVGSASEPAAAASSDNSPAAAPNPPDDASPSSANVYKIDPADGEAYNESAVSEGEANLGLALADDNYKEWMKLLTRFYEAYKLDHLHNDETLIEGFRTTALAVDKGFEYTGNAKEGEFSFFHVETLLNQVADLLDRCIQEREKFQDESTRAAKLSLEVKEFLTNDSLLRGLIRDGLFKLPLEFAIADRLSLANQQMYWTIAYHHHREAADSINSIDQYNYARHLAWLQYYADSKDVHPTINGSENSRSNHAREIAGNQAAQTINAQLGVNGAQAEESLERLQTSHQTYVNLQAKENWERLNKTYKEEQVRQARKLVRTKIRLCCMDGGALNFAERRDQSKVRFTRDFNDALSRLNSLSKGLSLLYGYSLSGGGDTTPEKELVSLKRVLAPDFAGKLDSITNQVRDAIAWLIRFQASEQTYRYCVSLRYSPDGSDTWDDGINKGGSWSIKIPEELFSGQRHVRLRGISLFANSTDNSIWRCTLSCDHNGSIKWLDGTNVQLDQSRIPKLFFGRVSQRESVRPPESGNGAAVHNISPFGIWQLEIASTQATGLAALQDIEIDLEVAVRVT